jgi:tRNA threonylcarbamoyladenosine biosynthesis protein TsaE
MAYCLISKNENETKNIAQAIATFFSSGDIILLEGDLGVGKTHFVQGFAQGVASNDTVTSPTFSIANFYRSQNIGVLHIDMYRIEKEEEFNDIGLADYYTQNIVLVEWGTKFPGYFEEYFLVSISNHTNSKTGRTISFSFQGEKYSSLFNQIIQNLPKHKKC